MGGCLVPGIASGQELVDAKAVAQLPHPGTVVPGAIAFTPDSRALSYLKADAPDSLSRVLWRVELPDGKPRIIARPPGGGDTDATVSREEALRRERQRLRETGITQVARASRADVTIVPLGGDLYFQKGGGPLERLTATPKPEIDPKPSPDGSKVAFVRENELFVLDIETRQETQLSQGATDGLSHGLAEFIAQEELDRPSGFWWSPDGAHIAYQETDERQIPLYTIAHQGGEEFSIETHRYPFPGAANAKVRLGVVAVTGGATRWLTLADPGEDFYLARVDWDGPKTILVQMLARDQKRLRLERIDIESDQKTILIEETAQTWINLHNDLRIVEGTGEILWSSESSGCRQLELHDRDGKLVRKLTQGTHPIDGVVALDAKRREVWFLAARKEKPLETHLWCVGLDGTNGRLVLAQPGTHRAVVAPDGEHYVDTFSSRSQPPVTTLRDRDGQIVTTLDDAGTDPRLARLNLAPPVLVSFPNRDGVTLHGAYYRPKAVQAGAKSPLIVMVYGGPHVQTVTNSWGLTADMTAQFLVAHGFAVWKCDNRGSSRRDRAFQDAVYRKMGVVEVQDQVDGVKFLLAREASLDGVRVGITGGSYGGYMTLRCLELAPETFHVGVASAPVTFWEGYDTAYTERYMSTPQDNPDGYKDSSVLTHVDRLTGRLLIIHGMIDENVHFRHTARLATALIQAGKDLSNCFLLPDERHSARRLPDRQYVAERLADFFSLGFGAGGGVHHRGTENTKALQGRD